MSGRIFIVIAMITGFFSCSTNSQRADEHYNEALKYLKNEDVSNAISEIDLALSLDSTDQYLMIKANLLAKIENPTAYDIYYKLVQNNFKLDTIHYRIGSLYYKEAGRETDKEVSKIKIQKSIDELTSSIKINSNYYDAYDLKFKALHNINEYEESLNTINSMIKIFGEKEIFIRNKGIEKIMMGDVSGGLVDLDNYISISTDSSEMSDAYRFKAIVYQERGEFKDAIDLFTIALKLDSSNYMTLMNRADCFIKLSNYTDACKDFRAAADLGYIRAYDEIKVYCQE